MEKSDLQIKTIPDIPPVAPAWRKDMPAPDDGSIGTAIGKWAYSHKDFVNNNPVGYLPYQWLRSAAASVPYGIGSAIVFMGTRKLMPEPGRVVDKFESGLKLALQIGGSFTFYRTFSKAGKAVKDDIFDPNKSEAETIEAVNRAGSTYLQAVTNQLPAEASSVPWGAFTLGYIMQLHKPAGAAMAAAAKNNQWALITHPESSVVQNSLVNTVAYSTFFEVSDRLAKDYKIRNKVWEGQPNTIVSNVSDVEQKDRTAGFMTQDPSLGRLLFRRVLPVAVGISAYTGAKRLGYRWFGGPMSMEKGFWHNAWSEGAPTSLFCLLLAATEPWEGIYDRFFDTLRGKRASDYPKDVVRTPDEIAKIERNNEELLAKLREKEQEIGKAGNTATASLA